MWRRRRVFRIELMGGVCEVVEVLIELRYCIGRIVCQIVVCKYCRVWIGSNGRDCC